MDRDLAIITGAGKGIGRATAIKLAKEGMDIVINYSSSEDAAKETASECEALGARVILVKGDVSKPEDCKAIVDAAMDAFGHIEVLVNNAGITRDGLMMRMSDEDFAKVIDINLVGTFNMMKAVSPLMLKKRYGRIINMASVVGIMGNVGQANYAASKAGVIGMTKSLAKEIAAKGITVNAVAPGFIETDMTRKMNDKAVDAVKGMIPVKRMGKPDEVADAVAFFAARSTEYITGQVICVDGGMCM